MGDFDADRGVPAKSYTRHSAFLAVFREIGNTYDQAETLDRLAQTHTALF